MKTKLLFLMLFAVILTGFAQTPGVTSVAVVGEAAGGWPGDAGNPGPTDVHQMVSTDGENWTLSALTLTTFATEGGIKFRANNDWVINWGAIDFPSGTGTQNGHNIECYAGTFDVEFNSTTGVYTFSSGTPPPTVKLIGTAVTDAGGITMSPTGPDSFRATNVTLVDGLGQFSVDTDIFGGDTFPTGTIADASLFIPIPAGVYSSVTFNTTSGNYEFIAAPLNPVVSITGTGVVGGAFGTDFDMTSTNANGENYTYTAIALQATAPDNEIKFRQDNAWAINWGDVVWPSGVGTQNGPNIIVGADGTYDVSFTRSTGAYSFSFPVVSLTGDGIQGGAFGTDVNMQTTDGLIYTLNDVVLVDAPVGGGLKFRKNNDWAINWGDAAWPTGTGTQNGPNVLSVAGTWDVTFNRVTAAYNFTPGLATTTFNSANFKVYPNPTTNVWNFTSAKQAIETIQIVDVLGKTVMTISPKDMNTTVDASSLTRGLYFAKISTANATETAKLMKN
ncbi:T9SS type A sorting domain-containing protein [Flavobacterium sp.]|uniref:T9SS type A sorting domain-containing protein n=1 Tax=Flavobacterium sp. TaxID=239 RepID=UPI00286BEFB0|nr:T9SS type A sorting domain-containing protein [Flavobacterium sp.]